MYGLSDDEIDAIRAGRYQGFPPPEAALLRMADAMSDTPSNVGDALYTELRRHFSEEQLIELAADAALEQYRARFNRVFDVDSDHLYRRGLRFKVCSGRLAGPRADRITAERRSPGTCGFTRRPVHC